ncbi:6-phospho-3-hexuloisomerase [Weizmannia coagulans]|uniref:6-phospho 3-hexuloisomerase n=2 Tax=Heyndrickxia TaxID=2837504 RepID=A0AAN0T9T3_HEYCO|nr:MULTISPECIES: 6-phospho-3-hexuloisomerase [Heyndrickxia]AJO24574.1 6-phospho 3-hexuloisomerase [Heyndrickxia coagulans]AKN53972.1 6-phospho-3-hexuloisomerase [Heyndrickxia coagulans]ATW84360.1 6-phospho-3-hexuloisomerase [Heyndrickxia coagulans]KGB30292.1 6-phospho 3-hexuloisomerase [Heyndrickxia coagulans]KXT19375.1 6-phospho 3-hexuloisomerase [Heyndrickxia coagulans]
MNREIEVILNEIQTVFSKIDGEQVEKLADMLASPKSIFVLGEGRSGLMAKSFAMRLMHLGFHVFVVGETITPSIQPGDLLIAVSGSGTTSNVVQAAEKAKKNGVSVVGVTSDPSSRLAQTSDSVVHIPSATKYRRPGEIESRQPLSSLFDQSVHLFFDAVCLKIAEQQKSGNEAALSRHSNLE